jgi:hypothetical protein
MAALVATFLLCAPALAQSGKVDVVTKSGGIVVKKVIKNGEIVDEDVKVFGDLDDETRDRILGLVKVRKPGDDRKKARKLKKKLKNKCDGCDCCRGGAWIIGPDDKKAHVFSFTPGLSFHLDDEDLPFGDELEKHIKKALKGKHLGGMFYVHPGKGPGRLHVGPLGLEGLGEQIRKQVEKALKEHGLNAEGLEDHLKILEDKDLSGWMLPFKSGKVGKIKGRCFICPEHDKDVKVERKARIRIDVNGETVLDKEIDAGKAPGKAKAFTYTWKTKDKATAAPKVKILRKSKVEKKSHRSTGDASIRRLERSIERLQQELKQLKRELKSIRPAEVKPAAARTRVI